MMEKILTDSDRQSFNRTAEYDIFLSYKREDEAKAARLARALEVSGYSVWWDRSLLAGDSWRSQIQRAIDQSQLMIVIWTPASTGPDGDFVRDEAAQGKQRGMLIPVQMETTALPLGFGELQCIDLRKWRGSTRDIFYRDLTASINAKLQGSPLPAPKGPARRALKRIGVGALPLLTLAAVFVLNLASVQEMSCSVKTAQPMLADFCGRLGWGGKPTREARLAWQALPAGNCDALLAFRQRYEDSPLRALADSRYAARQKSEREIWSPESRQLRLFVTQDGESASDLQAAQAAALVRAGSEAQSLCQGFATTARFRFRTATPQISEWQCAEYASGHVCGGRGEAVCELDIRGSVIEERC